MTHPLTTDLADRIRMIKELMEEGGKIDEMFAIEPGGMRQLTKMRLQANQVYFMGASSSPQMIFVTKVDKNKVHYTTYSAGGYRDIKQEQRPIIDDLIQRGTATWLRSGHERYQPGLASRLRKLLAGQKVSQEKLADYQLHEVWVKSAKDGQVATDKLWRAAEEYGNVGGRHGKKDYYLIITSVSGRSLRKLKKDRRFTVVKTADYRPIG